MDIAFPSNSINEGIKEAAEDQTVIDKGSRLRVTFMISGLGFGHKCLLGAINMGISYTHRDKNIVLKTSRGEVLDSKPR